MVRVDIVNVCYLVASQLTLRFLIQLAAKSDVCEDVLYLVSGPFKGQRLHTMLQLRSVFHIKQQIKPLLLIFFLTSRPIQIGC